MQRIEGRDVVEFWTKSMAETGALWKAMYGSQWKCGVPYHVCNFKDKKELSFHACPFRRLEDFEPGRLDYSYILDH